MNALAGTLRPDAAAPVPEDAAAGLAAAADGAVVAAAAPAPATLDVGLMRLCGRDVALPADTVREVVPRPATLQPVFAAGGAIGSIVIRGRVIPVIDLEPLLGFQSAGWDAAAGTGGVIVVLRYGDALLGLAMDSVSGLARLRRDSLQACAIPGVAGQLVTRNFLHGDAVVGLIDPEAVFALPGIPHARETAFADRAAAGARRPIVLLSAAGAELAIDAALVVATVPNGALRPGPVPSATWIGVVDYLGREVPVVDDLSLFGLTGRAGDGGAEPIVILRADGERLLGLRIDRVHRILQVPVADVRPLPAATAARLDLFCGAIVDGDGRESLLLAADALARSDALRTIAALSRIAGTAAAPGDGATCGTGGAAKHPFLVFRLGDRHRAVPLTSVTQIIGFPANVSRLDVPGSSLFGLASHTGRPLPLVDLGSEGSPRNLDFAALGAAVLVVEVDGAVTGCIVDALEMVVDAAPQRRPAHSAAEPGHFLDVRIGGTAKAVTICDLAEEARKRA
ncbi:chemotaxis protein CheW [Sphingosinicella sp. BN140058]|uniref:chemotaxis protein CheW n=1 Tax=Sphingosinicella sp. BN140058 TaxID=1892855 RepID=UPI001012CD7E|nr:chemotaxis protein CheW [Sphingosinicella sp. BN140058]QAY78671.1 hypothetical protein ETR14_20600 [Sphingosinicella sp. BN140058]